MNNNNQPKIITITMELDEKRVQTITVKPSFDTTTPQMIDVLLDTVRALAKNPNPRTTFGPDA